MKVERRERPICRKRINEYYLKQGYTLKEIASGRSKRTKMWFSEGLRCQARKMLEEVK